MRRLRPRFDTNIQITKSFWVLVELLFSSQTVLEENVWHKFILQDLPVTQPLENKIQTPNQWPGLILSLSITGLPMEGAWRRLR